MLIPASSSVGLRSPGASSPTGASGRFVRGKRQLHIVRAKTRRRNNWPRRVKFITKYQRTFRLRRDVPSKSAHILNAVALAVNANEAGMVRSNET